MQCNISFLANYSHTDGGWGEKCYPQPRPSVFCFFEEYVLKTSVQIPVDSSGEFR